MKSIITKESIEILATECINSRAQERPELEWLKSKYAAFMQAAGLTARQEADHLLYQKIFGNKTPLPSDILKIRYWRTGRHFPNSHKLCSDFGHALGLEPSELRFLLQGYFDDCAQSFEQASSDPLYQQRLRKVESLTKEYLDRVPYDRLYKMNIQPNQIQHYLRHLYYTDALFYIYTDRFPFDPYRLKHIASNTYNSELNRTLKLLGNVPRKTMIRHLILLGMPDISVEWINRHLEFFGYLPLTKTHTLQTGELFDRMLIQLITLYEACQETYSAEECICVMQDSCRWMDQIFKEAGKKHLRFMYFKALD